MKKLIDFFPATLAAPTIAGYVQDTKILLQQSGERMVIRYVIDHLHTTLSLLLLTDTGYLPQPDCR